MKAVTARIRGRTSAAREEEAGAPQSKVTSIRRRSVLRMQCLYNTICGKQSAAERETSKPDESCTSKPKSRKLGLDRLMTAARRNQIFWDLGFEMQDLSGFEISASSPLLGTTCLH